MCAPTPNNGCQHVVLLIGPEYFLRTLRANLLGSDIKHWSDSVNAVTYFLFSSAGPQLEISCMHSDGADDSPGDDKVI